MTLITAPVVIRYWKLKESDRVIAVDCQMTPRWTEISSEEFMERRSLVVTGENKNDS